MLFKSSLFSVSLNFRSFPSHKKYSLGWFTQALSTVRFSDAQSLWTHAQTSQMSHLIRKTNTNITNAVVINRFILIRCWDGIFTLLLDKTRLEFLLDFFRNFVSVFFYKIISKIPSLPTFVSVQLSNQLARSNFNLRWLVTEKICCLSTVIMFTNFITKSSKNSHRKYL